MTNDPTERAALATAAAKLSTASNSRESKPGSPGVAQPETARTDASSEERLEEGDLGNPDAQENAHLGDGTAR